MSRQIFRETSLERLSSPEQLDQAIRVTSPMTWLALSALAVMVLAGICWSLVGTVPEKVAGRGILISPGGVLDVASAAQGRIISFQIRPGEWVESGQVVARIAQPDIENELVTAKAELTEANAQYQKLLDFQQRDLAVQKGYFEEKRKALAQKMSFTEDRLKWLQQREAAESDLIAKGLILRQRIIDTKIEVNTAKEEYEHAEDENKKVSLDENTLTISQEKERIEQSARVASLERRVGSLKDKLSRNEELVSPYTGFIVELKVNAGEVVEQGHVLFSMLPHERPSETVPGNLHGGELVATLYVRPEDGKKVHVGMAAQILPSTVKREEYGFIEGRVTYVASIPSTPEGIERVLKNRQLVQDLSGGGAPIEVMVELLLDPKSHDGYKWSSSAGPEADINPGTLSEGTITIRRIHLVSLLVPVLEPLLEQHYR